MKKLIACSMALLCLLLCACGSYRADYGTGPEMMEPLESMMPNTEDGVVTDRDGVIEDNEDAARSTTVPNSTSRP